MAIEIGHKLKKNDRIIVYQPNSAHSFKSGTLKGYVYEHIYIAECKLGRTLLKGEVVHHIDGNKENNTPDNIIVFKSQHDHAVFHTALLSFNDIEKLDNGSYKIPDELFKYTVKFGKKRLMAVFTCEQCGKQFEDTKDAHRFKHVYCSIQCTNQAKRKKIIK